MKKLLALALAVLTIAAAFAVPTFAADTDVVTKGLVIHYDGINNAGTTHDSKAVLWKDATGNKNDFGLDLDATNYWKDNALHVDAALLYFPDKALEVVNGKAWTVEIAFGEIELLGTSYDTFIYSDNDHFSIFRRTNNNSIEFKGNDAKAERVVVADGKNLMNESTVTVTYTLSGMVRIYVDGKLMGEKPQNGKEMGADTLALGHFDPARYWTGDVHSIRFYDRELTADEVAANAEADAIKYRGKVAETKAPETTEAPETTAAPVATTQAPAATPTTFDAGVALTCALLATAACALLLKKKVR